jgi:hypothetical protein
VLGGGFIKSAAARHDGARTAAIDDPARSDAGQFATARG